MDAFLQNALGLVEHPRSTDSCIPTECSMSQTSANLFLRWRQPVIRGNAYELYTNIDCEKCPTLSPWTSGGTFSAGAQNHLKLIFTGSAGILPATRAHYFICNLQIASAAFLSSSIYRALQHSRDFQSGQDARTPSSNTSLRLILACNA